jgi:predicted Ser/Thr protein kinase
VKGILFFQELAASVKITSTKNKSILVEYDPSLTLIGKGRSAYVFRISKTNKAMKVFFPKYAHLAKEESDIYKLLQHIPHYPSLYETGPNYLVIDYIEGSTLFECVTKGILISDEVVKEIDMALHLARQEGLNPSDIHLRNLFLTLDKKVKIIDVARFRQAKNCIKWGDLKYAFYHYYKKRFFPKKIPAFILNIIAVLYKKELLTFNSDKDLESYHIENKGSSIGGK